MAYQRAMRATRDASSAAGAPSGADSRRRSRSSRGQGTGERLIAGVPARIMKPRLTFLMCLVAIVSFGLLMVYSASAVEAQSDNLDPMHYLLRQVAFVLLGTVAIVVIARWRNLWKLLRDNGSWVCWGIVLFLLVVVSAMGAIGGGARRWIDLGFFTLQPSEFMKPAMILVAAKLLSAFYIERSIDGNPFIVRIAAAVLIPLFFIGLQPDLGTVIIIGMTVFVMAFLSGLSMRLVIGLFAFLVVAFVGLMLVAPYRLQRFTVFTDPWADQYGAGYQATLAIMAFASGGLFGRGIGNSTMKYMYLPEAHNDYILAIIGEEVGFFGTAIFLVVFFTMIWNAFKIAEQADSPFSRLVAQGCAIVLAIQFLVNAAGILSLAPMTGKTLPFISYGGSSMLASMILAGIILRVSIESGHNTSIGARRETFAVMSRDDEGSSHVGRSTAGRVRVRRSSASGPSSSAREGFSVYDGAHGGSTRETPRDTSRPYRRHEGPYGRIDLHGDAADRLRGGTTSRGDRSRRPRSRRDRYDR